MPVQFIDNYAKNSLEAIIRKSDGSPLYGEIWFYQELLKFNENGLLKDDTWHVKHNFNLSTHPASPNKVEGQIDFLIVSQYGILVVEIKGGGVEVDSNDVYFQYELRDKSNRYETQNPFTQVKEYEHSLRRLIDSAPFIYRAVVFPHEAGFRLTGPQLEGYKFLFFSKRDLDLRATAYARNVLLYEFLSALPRNARRHLITQLNPQLDKQDVAKQAFDRFPLLSSRDISRLRSELFPKQNSYGFDPDKIRTEILLEENYEILNGLRKNRKVMVQGAPGTGKTVLATKFLAQNLLKQHKGVFFCANKLLRAKMEHLMLSEYKLDSNLVTFVIYHPDTALTHIDETIDFIVIDEAQEFFDKGLFEFVEQIEINSPASKFLILYDPEQAIIQEFKDIDWYTEYFIQDRFVHYLFDTVWRCCQNKEVLNVSGLIRDSRFKALSESYTIRNASILLEKLSLIKELVDQIGVHYADWLFLIHSELINPFRSLVQDYFKSNFEELTESNINLAANKIRFTTPIKFRGLECDNVVLIAGEYSERSKIQCYVGATRAINSLKLIVWRDEAQ